MKTTGLVLVIIAVFLFFSCGKKTGNYDASGVFEATEIIVSAEESGKIMQLNVEEGRVVDPEVKLGVIDTFQLYLKKKQLEANMEAVKSNRVSIPKQIASLKQQLQTQRNELERYRNLVRLNAANQKQADDIQANISVLEKELSASMETLTNKNTSISGESTALEIESALLADRIEKSIIRSPIHGTILSKYAEAGEMAVRGKALFKVADMDNMFLRAYITSGQLSEVMIGQAVRVFPDFGVGAVREYEGIIAWISDKAEFTPKTILTKDERANQVYAVKIAVKNDGYLKKGMYGDIKLK